MAFGNVHKEMTMSFTVRMFNFYSLAHNVITSKFYLYKGKTKYNKTINKYYLMIVRYGWSQFLVTNI